MIQIHNLSVRYGDSPVLSQVSLTVPEGEMALVVGPTGSGKTTLLRALAAQVPHLSGGTASGSVCVAGRDTRSHQPRDLADVVGYVAQDPRLSFVADTVEEELAFTLEQLGIPPDLMRRRVEDVLDLLSIEHLRHRSLHTLSGGEAQRVAIGAVLTAQPRVLVLDEPTSALDPVAAEEVLAALSRLVLDSGLTVVLAEHRLERVAQFADQVIALQPAAGGGATVVSGAPATIFGKSEIRPPVAELGSLLRLPAAPVTVREARRAAREVREELEAHAGDHAAGAGSAARSDAASAGSAARSDAASAGSAARSDAAGADPAGGDHSAGQRGATEVAMRARGLSVTYGEHVALADVSMNVHAGEILAVMGRNGAGKSTLLWALTGALAVAKGKVEGGAAVLVPQSPEDLLFRLTVAEELAAAEAGAATASTGLHPTRASVEGTGRAQALLDEISPGIDTSANPRDLSEGQRLSLALCVQLVRSPQVFLLDEPTRGLDYPAKERLASILQKLRGGGTAVVVASHDVEFLALIADRVVHLSAGSIVADGPARHMLTDSAFSAPQMARVFAPLPLLTVAEVASALGRSG